MGIPAALTTDQGSEFKNELNANLMNALGISHRLTSCYHPQANGLVERFNQTLIHSLNKAIVGDKESWDEHISEIVYAYNTAIQVGSIQKQLYNYGVTIESSMLITTYSSLNVYTYMHM